MHVELGGNLLRYMGEQQGAVGNFERAARFEVDFMLRRGNLVMSLFVVDAALAEDVDDLLPDQFALVAG